MHHKQEILGSLDVGEIMYNLMEPECQLLAI